MQAANSCQASLPPAQAGQKQLSFVCNARPPRPPQPSSNSNSGSSDSVTTEVGPKELTILLCSVQTSTAVLQLVCSHHTMLNEIHAATALHRTTKHMQPQHSQIVLKHAGYPVMLSLVEKWAPCFKEQQTGSAVWALHKLPQMPPSSLVHSLMAAVERNIPTMTSRQVATSVYALLSWGTAQAQTSWLQLHSRLASYLRTSKARQAM